jgi:uncharacterized membrane protein YhaH (DUF805 family)
VSRSTFTYLLLLAYSLTMALRRLDDAITEDTWLLSMIFGVLVLLREDGLTKR